MKTHITRYLSAAATLGILACAPLAIAAENMIPNGDLENVDVLPNGLPEGMVSWQSNDGEPIARYYLSQEEKSSGSNSLCIERLENPEGHSRILVASAIPVEPGKRYSFSCKIKSTEFAKDPGIFIYASDGKTGGKSDEWLSLENDITTSPGAKINGGILYLSKAQAEDPEGFNKVERTFTIPADGSFLTIYADFSWCAASKAWFDDFELLPLD